jgi:hypothetical protein
MTRRRRVSMLKVVLGERSFLWYSHAFVFTDFIGF